MRFKKHDGTYFELKVLSSTPKFLINYELQAKSDRTFFSIDRGVMSDRHSTILSFTQPNDYVNELVNELKILRDNNKYVIIDECPEPIFADNIDHNGTLNCLVVNVDKQQGADLKVQSIDIELLLESPSTTGSNLLPQTINCVNTSYKGYTIWNTHINESYYRSNWFVDREADTFEFEGQYVFSLDDNISLLNFWTHKRGNPFQIVDGAWGTPYMFGGSGGNTTHDVIISDISYQYISPTLRQTTIKLIKVG